MKLGLQQRLVQELRLTPQLILQMKILQVSAAALEELVEHELQENPALEISDDGAAPEAEAVIELTDDERPSSLSTNEAIPEPADRGDSETFTVSQPDEYSVKDLLPPEGYSSVAVTGRDDDEPSAVDLAAEPGESLVDALMPHLRAVLSPEDAALAEYVTQSLDADGFLTMMPEEIAEVQGVALERVHEVLHLVQRAEPGGLACRDRRESFLVQIELAGSPPDSLECKLVRDHWDLLMKRQTTRIARLCGVDEDAIRRAVERLLNLEMRPARRFAASGPDYVRPDFSIEWQGDALVAVPTDETTPRLRLSRAYREILLDPKSYAPEQVAFAREKLQRALSFLKGIESRRRTLRRLAELIIDEQHEFFVHGPEHLRPATLRDAAVLLKVHPSTVSRAIAGKYIESSQGIQPMHYFFKAGTSDKSRTSVKERVQALIAAEDKSSPLSDDQLRDLLKQESISVSRRVIAKYRAELGIASRNQRRGF